jgi:dUTP pyrophosphatase
MPPLRIKFVRTSRRAFAPVRAYSRSAGLDIKSAYDYTIPPLDKVVVHTDLKLQLPRGYYGRLASRSSLSLSSSITVLGGVIDEDFTGPLLIILFNLSRVPYHIKSGDKVAQFICEKIGYPTPCEVSSLNPTERGEKGFGSSGK